MSIDQLAADEALARKLFEEELKEEERLRKLQEENDAAIAQQLSEESEHQQMDNNNNRLLTDELLAKELVAAEEAAMAQRLVTVGDEGNLLGNNLQWNHLLNEQVKNQQQPKSVTNGILELTSRAITDDEKRMLTQIIINETYTDLHEMFKLFNQIYFDHQLDMVEVKWSKRMTLCAGTCAFRNGGHCIITLSEPLLKFRSKKELVETLLHEMIHALLFVTSRNTDRDGHGLPFLTEADRINKIGNVKITVYHNFHDEVEHYQKHVWRCNGICQDRPPYFGIVKRSMNRPPQKADPWFAQHQLDCGGTFIKISEPESSTKSKKRKQQSTKITDYIVLDDVDDNDNAKNTSSDSSFNKKQKS
ncbi:SprT-like family-domain-containing protein [Mycotypha africana]|uniref:SprT-like family-domain-containing protein n=1 Tax=Mycotypha africana TaxID=64632 RepID=UPI00230163F1|nr:SprT-like family-domain-containing protein [Mycotypha africana]KAI8991153.1 SprT-like family-domain-containing protein [Mycotypha africana]